MFINTLAFEWRYFTRQPSFIVTCLLFFMLAFLSLAIKDAEIASGGNVMSNSPHSISIITMIFGIMSMFLVVNFVANTAIRNQQTKMAELICSKPLGPFSYSLGRFIGSYLVCATVFSMVPLGLFVASLMPWLDAEQFGANSWSIYLIPYLYVSLITLFIMASLFYCVAIRFNSMMAVYLTALALFIGYSLSGAFASDPELRPIVALFDPFGLRAYFEVSRYWTPFEKNTLLLSFEGSLMQNRLLWLAISISILVLAGNFFKPLALQQPKTKKPGNKSSKLDIRPEGNNIKIKPSGASEWSKFLSRTHLEIKQLFLSPALILLLIFAAFIMISQFINPAQQFGAPSLPLTQNMIELIGSSLFLVVIVVITYYSAEVVWRERTTGIGDIIDSMPVQNIVLWSSKLVAVFCVITAVFITGALATISNQLVSGFDDIDLLQYVISLTFFTLVPIFLTVVLAFFIQALSPNKYVGMLIFVVYIFATESLSIIGIEHNMFEYAASPALQYSELNEYGWFLQTQFWYMTYWSALGIIFGILSYALWHRGPQLKLREKLNSLGYQLNTKGKVALLTCALVFVGSGAYIHYNTRVLNDFVVSDAILDLRENYERMYAEFEDNDIPTVTTIDATVDIFPQQRRIDAIAKIAIQNRGTENISRFLVNLPDHSRDHAVIIEGGKLGKIDPNLNTAWFTFDTPLKPGEIRSGSMSLQRSHKGFKDGGEDVTTVENGTFIDGFSLFPRFGFIPGYKMLDRHERRKRGLPETKRAYSLEDASRYSESDLGKGMSLIDFNITVSTSEDQTAIAPGYLQEQWQENGRNYFRYEMDSPMANFYSILSGRLAVKKEVHKSVNIEIYYHPEHYWNVDKMIESVRDSIDYFSETFGPYQHKQMRVIEYPGYRAFAQSFANTVPYSENIGFTTDLSDPDNIDSVYYVTSHEVAHQWFGHQLDAANVQGSAVISESLSQYAALMVMQRKYGETKLRKFLDLELDRYLMGRANETIEEMPMMRSEGQAYIHYNKGSVVMMALKDKLGEERLNRALRKLVKKFKFTTERYATTLDLMASLKEEANEDEKRFIDKQFSQITLYDLRATSIETAGLDNDKVEITFTVDANQYVADGQGEETEQPLDEWVDIVLFSQDPNDFSVENEVIYQQKHRLVSGENVLELIVDKLPAYAGVDPFVRLIDRDSDNNIIKL